MIDYNKMFSDIKSGKKNNTTTSQSDSQISKYKNMFVDIKKAKNEKASIESTIKPNNTATKKVLDFDSAMKKKYSGKTPVGIDLIINSYPAPKNRDELKEYDWLKNNRDAFMSTNELLDEIKKLEGASTSKKSDKIKSLVEFVGTGLSGQNADSAYSTYKSSSAASTENQARLQKLYKLLSDREDFDVEGAYREADKKNIFDVFSPDYSMADYRNDQTKKNVFGATVVEKHDAENMSIINADNELRSDLEKYFSLKSGASVGGSAMGGNIITSDIAKKYANSGIDFDALYETFSRYKNAKNTENLNKKISDFTSKNAGTAVLGNVASIATNVFGAGPAIADTVSSKIKDLFTDDIVSVDINSPAWALKNATDEIRETTSQMIVDKAETDFGGEVGNFLYQTGMSLADMGASYLAGGFNPAAYAMIMSSTAATDKIKSVTKNGGSVDEALLSGIVAGALEAVFEKIGIDNLVGAITKGSGKSVLKTFLSSALSEGLEELGTDISNSIADAIINGDNSEFNNAVYTYMDAGYSASAAQAAALTDLAKQFGLSFAGGALSGGVIGGVGGSINKNVYNNTLREVGQQVNSSGNAAEFIDYAKNFGIDTGKAEKLYGKSSYEAQLKKLAEESVIAEQEAIAATDEKYNNNAVNTAMAQTVEKLGLRQKIADRRSNLEVGKLFERLNSGVNEKINSSVANIAEEILTETGMDNQYATEYAQLISKAVEGTISESEHKILAKNQTAMRILDDITAANSEIHQAMLNQNFNGLSDNAVRYFEALAPALTEGADLSSFTVKKELPKTAEVQENNPKEKPAEPTIPAITADADTVLEARESVKNIYGDAGTRTVEFLVKRINGNEDVIRNLFDEYYVAGSLGETDINNVTQRTGITLAPEIQQEVKNQAFAAGISDYHASSQSARGTNAVRKGSVTVSKSVSTQISDEEKSFLDLFARTLGVEINIVPEIFASGKKAEGKYSDGKLYLSEDVFKGDLWASIFSHELGHHLSETAPEQWRNYKKFVIENMRSNPQRYASILAKKKIEYRQVQKNILDMEIMDEIACDCLELFLYDSKFTSEMIERDRSFVEKVRDWLKNFIAQLSEAIHSFSNKQSARVLNSVMQQMDNYAAGLALVNSLLEQGAKTVNQAMSQNAEKAENRTNKNTATSDGDVKYSIATDSEGSYVKVDVNQNIFDGKNIREMQDIACKLIKDNFKGKVLSVGEYGKAYVNKRSAEEYAYPANRRMNDTIKEAKMRSSIELDNLLAVSEFVENQIDDGRHPQATGGWNVYKTRFEVANTMFSGEVKIMITDRGYVFYDVTKIEKLPVNGGQTEYNSVAASGNSSNNRISQNDSAVNTHSMQDGEKDTTKFSLASSVERKKELIAVHNMTVNELQKTLELGGLPMPSIAIIKAERGHSEYGDVSIVFPKDVVDPKKSPYNKVYGGDAWTPTYPTIEFKVNEKVSDKISKIFNDVYQKYGSDEARPLYNYANDLEHQLNNHNGEAGLIEWLKEDEGLMQLYLLYSERSKVEPVIKQTVTELSDAEVEMYDYLVAELGNNVIAEFKTPEGKKSIQYRNEYYSKHGEQIETVYKQMLKDLYNFSDEGIDNVINNMRKGDFITLIRKVYLYVQNGKTTVKEETDRTATSEAIRKTAKASGFNEWIEDLFRGVEEKSGIRNNADYFTSTGNRRSWEALHWENNLENVVKVMKAQNNGVAAFFSGHGIWAVSAKDYRSIDEIKSDSDRLKTMPQEQYNAIKEEFGMRFNEIALAVMDKSESNQFIATDNAMQCIIDAVRRSKTKSGILRELKQYRQLDVTETAVDDIVALVSDIANMPTEYFEAKPQRAVMFDEIATIIIPEGAASSLKQELSDRDISYLEYEDGNEQDRLEKLNSLDSYLFSFKESDIEFIEDEVVSEQEAVQQANENEMTEVIYNLIKIEKPSQKAIYEVSQKILSNTASRMSVKELAGKLSRLLDYIENGEADITSIQNETKELARQVISRSDYTDNSAWEQYKDVRKQILRKTFYVNRADIGAEDIKQAALLAGRRFYITTDATRRGDIVLDIDEIYEDLHNNNPEFFPETNSPMQQIENISVFLSATSKRVDNPYTSGEMGMSEDFAADILAGEIYHTVVTGIIDRSNGIRTVDITKAKDAASRYYKGIEQLKRQAARYSKDYEKFAREQKNKTIAYRELARKEVADKKAEIKTGAERRQLISSLKRLYKDSVNLLLGKRNDRLGTPQELKSALFDVVELVNLQNGMYPGSKYNERILSMRTRIHNMRETLVNYKTETDAKGNEVVSEYAVDILDALRKSTQDGKKTIDLLSNDELRNLVNVLQHVKGLVTDANKMFSEQLNADYDKLGNDVINELINKRNHLGGTNSLKTLMTTNQLMPEYFFERIGGTLENLFRNIYNTEGEQFRILQRFVADASVIAQKHKFNEWGLKETKFEYMTSRGEKMNIDLFNVMSLYALYKREKSNFGTISETMHIMHGGEIEFTEDLGSWKEALNNSAATVRNLNSKSAKVQKIQEELADEGKGDSPTKSYFLSEQDVKNLIGMLGDEQKAFADSMIRYLSNDVAKIGNEASRKMFNHDIFLEKCYFPMSVNKTHLSTNIDANAKPKQVQNAPMTKHVSTFADTAIVVRSFMDVWIEHVNQMSVYAATSPALKDFMRVYNYKTKPPVENKTGNVAVDESERQNTKAYSVKALIKEKFGADYTEYIEELMRDLNGGYRTVNEFGPLINATKKIAVALSLSCAIQQPAAMARAFSILDVKNFANYSKKGYDEMMKYSAIAQIKATNGYDTLSGPSLLYEIVNHNNDEKFAQTKMFLECMQKHNWKMASQFFDEFLFYLPKKMDEITWTAIWNSCKKQVRKEGKFKTENEAFFKAVTEVFENVVRRTQVYDSTFQKSGNLRSKSQLVNMEMAFMTEPTVSWNMLLDAKQKLQAGDKKTATRIVTSVAASSICAIILKSFIGALRKIEKDDDVEDFLLSWFDLSTQNGVSELFGFLPIIKDIYSIFDGYSIERMEFANIERIINAFKALDSEEKSMSEKITDVGAALANVFGVPVTTIVRGIRSSINVAHNILHIADEPYTKAMLEATKNGDNLIIAQIYDEQIANGLTKATILKQYRQAMAENIPEITEAIQLLSRGDETAYYKKCREIIDMGFDYSDIKASINLLLDEKEAKQNASLLAKAKTWVKSSFDFDYVAADIEVPDEYYNSTFSEMVEAVQDGDTSGFTKMYNQLLSDGYTEAQVKSNYREAIANEIPEIVTAAEYLQNGETGKYSITIGKIAESGFALADVQSAVNKYISSNSVGLTDSEKFAGSRISDIGTDIAGDVAVIAEEELFSGAIYNYDMLYSTMIEQGSNGTDYKKMYNYLLNNGTSKKSIENAIENRVEKTVKKWINAQNSGEYTIYESCLKELTAYYGNRDKAVRSVNKYRAEQNKLIENYINAHSESKKTEAKEALIKEFGDWDTASKAIEYYKK